MLSSDINNSIAIIEKCVGQVHGQDSKELRLVLNYIKNMMINSEELIKTKEQNSYLIHYGSKTDWNGDVKYTELGDLMRRIPKNCCKAYYMTTRWGKKKLVTNASSAQFYLEQNKYIEKDSVTKFYKVTPLGKPYIYSITKKGNTVMLTPLGVEYFTDKFGNYPRNKQRTLFSTITSLFKTE